MSFADDLFAPGAVALVGASADAGKNTARPQRYLQKHGYSGRVIPVNPARKEVLGERAYPSLAEAPEGIRHAFVMAPGDAVERALEDCGARRIPVMSVYSDGFADAGPAGMARQERLAARAKSLGVRVLGPNSMGVINLTDRVALTVNAVLEMETLPVGGISMVSQSGTMLGTVLSRGAARGLGFAKMVSLGNECDLGAGDVVDLFAEDAATKVILLFLETVRDAGRLAAASRKAFAAGKSVVAYKLGRSALGEALARSHTGALAGSDAAMDAFFRDCGILRVDMLETLIEIAPLVAGRRPLALSRAPRVAVVTTTGGGAASVVDRLGGFGIEPVAPDEALRAQLAGIGVKLTDSPIVDLTMAGTSKQYAQVLEALLASPACDGVLATVGSSAMFHPEHAVRPITEAPQTEKPLAAFFTPQAERSLALLAEKGIAGFRTPEACADAFKAYFDWRGPRRQPRLAAPAWPANLPRKGALDERQALSLFGNLGIPVVESAVAVAPDFAHGLAYPVVAKILSPDIAHKTEAGGVALGIGGDAEFRSRVAAMLCTGPGPPARCAHRRRARATHASRTGRGNRRLPRRSTGRTHDPGRRRRQPGGALQGFCASYRTGEYGGGRGNDRASDRAGDRARLSRPAARRSEGARAGGVGAVAPCIASGTPGRGSGNQSPDGRCRRRPRRGRPGRPESLAERLRAARAGPAASR